MKKMKRLAVVSLATIAMVSCGGGGTTSGLNSASSTIDTPNDEISLRDTFTNKFDEEKIPGQWSEYGVGDPFVYRFNGKYYLYCSTKNFEYGVRGWVSDDMIHWSQITGEGLDEGYVSNDGCTVTAYAPEVMYHNGYFYMLQSQGGNGHYILRSEKPEGPFVKIVDNFGESIDGSFFVDDDEQIYMLRASNTGIRLIKVNDDWTMGSSKTLDNTQIGGWTEGPYLLKRNGIYYLTYTGNNVTSEGYRVGYSYATGEVFNRSAFTQGETILLNTESDFNGLGHSSTVLGPDMDSYYIAYHNLNSSGGPDRSFNLSRLSFSGTDMSVDYASLYDNFVPAGPEFKCDSEAGLESNEGLYLSNKASGEKFTAEFNFVGEGTKCIVSFEDNNNYAYVKVADNKLSLIKVENGSERNIETVSFTKTYDFTKLHTIRVASADKEVNVYFDNMNKISTELSLKGGKIGYAKAADTVIKFTAFSNVGNGSSDKEEVFQGKVLATNYYESSFSNKAGVVQEEPNDEDEFNGHDGSFDVKLAKSSDSVTYKYWVKEAGTYGVDLTLDKKYQNRNIVVQIDNNQPVRMKTGKVDNIVEQYYKTTIGEVNMSAGAHYVKISGDSNEIAFHSFETFKSSPTWPLFENDLSQYVMQGAKYINSWKIRDNGHYALSGNRNLMYFGDGTFTDVTMEVDIELVGETQASSCGVLLRAKNPAFASVDDVSSIQGYYCGINNSKAFISKCDYNNSEMDASADALSLASDTSHHLKITAKGNKITLDVDNGQATLEYNSAIGFTNGNIGLYTDGAACIYRNLKIYH